MLGLGIQELLVIFIILLFFFGTEKIPQFARSLGKGISEFRHASNDLKKELQHEQVANTITCSNCKHTVDPNAKFCMECGTPIISNINCPNCQKPLLKEEKFCSQCGCQREG